MISSHHRVVREANARDLVHVYRLLAAIWGMLIFSCLCGCGGVERPDAGVPLAERSRGSRGDSPAEDPFYRKRPIYVTWIMIWNGSTEKHWWRASDYHGCKVSVDGTWQSINWNDPRHIDVYCASIHKAGIDVIVLDLTNGFRWEWQAKRVQRFCLDHGMKFAVAFNPQDGSRMEAGCKRVWDLYASAETPAADAYLQKDGKPVVVLYTWRNGYRNSIAVKGPYRERFCTVWASGEDSDRNKWGWQLEPHIGPVGSEGAMFVTGSVKFGSPRTKADEWRTHLSWLDYGFIMARRSTPKYLIVGSFDDVHERNAWMVVDTEDAPRGWQMHDRTGAISKDCYYRRVGEWLKDGPSTIAGGLIPDGAYRVRSADGRLLGAADDRRPQSPVVLRPSGENIEHFIWFYHVGSNVYRLVKLNAGLALESRKEGVVLNWDGEAAAQRWILEMDDRGYRILNEASGEALSFADATVTTEARNDAVASQYWSLIKEAMVDEAEDVREQNGGGDAPRRATSPVPCSSRSSSSRRAVSRED